MNRLDLGPIGVSLEVSDDDTHLDAARELERLGYSALWLPGGQLDRLDRLTELVGATTQVRIGSAIISPDVYGADEVTSWYAQLEVSAPGRVVVGLGGSQTPPALPALHEYLDRLDRDGAVPVERRLLAALGPRKLEIARDRSAGALTLLVTPDYTRQARAALGAEALLVVDQFVMLEDDPAKARETARAHLRFLAGVAGYRANFARMGFTDTEISTLGVRLVDELVAWGDADAIAARVDAHRAAGADHVVLAVLADDDQPGTLEVARRLAPRASR
ncbi:MAG TPA: TIGR03620 family F420-dependent LLM class oxidoreductase [Nocardioides sp.]|nr:TIGR03620 family F420-dependent LLM class oxidoreductase [Nocardioides sp.]